MPDDTDKTQLQETNHTGRGLAIGLVFGAALGVVFGIALDNMAFMSIGIGAGLVFGVAIGASLNRRAQQGEPEPKSQEPE